MRQHLLSERQTNALGASYSRFNEAGELIQSTDGDGRASVYQYNGIGQKLGQKGGGRKGDRRAYWGQKGGIKVPSTNGIKIDVTCWQL